MQIRIFRIQANATKSKLFILGQSEIWCEFSIRFNKLMIANFEKPETIDKEKYNFVILFPIQVYSSKYTLDFDSISPACG